MSSKKSLDGKYLKSSNKESNNEEDANTSFESTSTNSFGSHSIRSQLWDGLEVHTADALSTYLSHNDVKEEDPILVLEFLPFFDTLRGNMVPGANKIEVVNALNVIAVDNIGNLGTCFLFASHNDLQVARRTLRDSTIPGNISWAFYYGPAATANLLAEMNTVVPAARQQPTIKSRMITFYSHATGRLAHDEFDFFMH
jgi:hypothetical protein